MADAFDCPKCGAPLTFDPNTMGDQETISCTYCNETVVIPENLRVHKTPRFVFTQPAPPVAQSPTYYPAVLMGELPPSPPHPPKDQSGAVFSRRL
jgi:DNA-directed RNA polymerase subunit RPC12/RpoP